MYRSLISVRYAKSLFLKAQEEKTLDETMEDIRFVQSTFNKYPELLTTLNHPITYSSQKREIIQSLFDGKVNPVTLDFLLLIVRNHRDYYFPSIFRNFIDFYNDEEGIKTVELTTAVRIGDEEREDIKKYIIEVFKANKISFTEHLKPDIIGGFIIQIEDKLLDVSVRRQLNRIKQELISNNNPI
jgi:F-type H+-transporting ATPase subunit delta